MNANGNAGTLTPVGEGNALALRHAAYSPRLREPRARAVADALMGAPHMTELDLFGALEIGRRARPSRPALVPRSRSVRDPQRPPLRAIYRRAVARGEVAINPTTGLEFPAVREKRDRIASPGEAAALIAALPEAERALSGCMRRGTRSLR